MTSERIEEIYRITDLLLSVWLQAPELRLGQLLENVTECGRFPKLPVEEKGCFWARTDEAWEKGLEKWSTEFQSYRS